MIGYRFARGPYRPRDRTVCDDDAYMNLLAEIVTTAIKDHITGAPKSDGKIKDANKGLFTTEEYLFTHLKDDEDYLLSFQHICKIFNIPVGKARAAIREQRAMRLAGKNPPILERRKVDYDF